MSLSYFDVARAIRKKYDDTAALNSLTDPTTDSVADGLFYGMAPENSQPNYIVFNYIDAAPDYTLSSVLPREDITVQFTVITGTRTAFTGAGSPEENFNLMDAIDAAYGVDGSGLTFVDSTYSHTVSLRQRQSGPVLEDGDLWVGSVDYLMMFANLT